MTKKTEAQLLCDKAAYSTGVPRLPPDHPDMIAMEPAASQKRLWVWLLLSPFIAGLLVVLGYIGLLAWFSCGTCR